MTKTPQTAIVDLTDEYNPEPCCVFACPGPAIALYRYRTSPRKAEDKFVYYPVCAKAVEDLISKGAIDERGGRAGQTRT